MDLIQKGWWASMGAILVGPGPTYIYRT
uniref:Uncharacterized protein n=1 Tax=Nelumbo nucifera TaxID=4432 RepID=A0A822XNN6_NELNU|nr:TPA_asm: hypothetical protein HUJ06_021828 [Nelumbo nucifera]